MNSIEKARKLIKQEGECNGFCNGFMCRDDGLCPCYIPGSEIHYCHFSKKLRLAHAKAWLAEHEEKEIIGWPGNAEEMRQYIGRKVMAGNHWSFKRTADAIFTLVEIAIDSDMPFYVGRAVSATYVRYIKILPEPAVKEYTIQEIADKLGVPVETIRIKDK